MIREEIKSKLQWALCGVYCDNCRHNEPDAPRDSYGVPVGCDDCHRKYMGWEPSRALLDKIIDICQTMMNWIPVTERCPDTDRRVLCQTVTKKGVINMIIGYYADDRWCCGMNSNVVAWMDLPEPYTEEKENE